MEDVTAKAAKPAKERQQKQPKLKKKENKKVAKQQKKQKLRKVATSYPHLPSYEKRMKKVLGTAYQPRNHPTSHPRASGSSTISSNRQSPEIRHLDTLVLC